MISALVLAAAKGVAMGPPPPALRIDVDQEVARLLGEVPDDANGALMTVVTTKGVNVVVAGKVGDGWTVQAYVGKTWGGPISGGGRVMKTW